MLKTEVNQDYGTRLHKQGNKANIKENNFGMIPFPVQYEYRVFDVDICFAEALQLLAS